MFLRIIRTILALLSLLGMTILFLDVTGLAVENLGCLPKAQFLPALLAGSFVAVAATLILTLLVGRIYCSVICPLGIMQDVVSRVASWFAPKLKRKIGRFKYTSARTKVRNICLGLFVLLVVLGVLDVWSLTAASLIEPYSAFGRIVSSLFGPLVEWVNNTVLAPIAEANDSYLFFRINYYTNIVIVVVAAIELVALSVFAWIEGRGYCNTICPVGTVLGFLSRFSLLRPVIDTAKCNGCRSCERHCKASCIDAKNHEIDMSRCVDCMNCVAVCRQKAISFTLRRKPSVTAASTNATKADKFKPEADSGRRHFVSIVGLAGGALLGSAATGKLDGGLTPLTVKSPVKRNTAVVPAGTGGHKRVAQHCVGCQLCVQNCPNGVLRASSDLGTFMQPVMDFTDGYCVPECTVCATVCPAGVFSVIDEVAKSSIKVGTAIVDPSLCLIASQEKRCGSCATHCPTGAVSIERAEDGRMMPIVNDAVCIGCGACEYHCPVGSVESTGGKHSAIHVEGLEVHRVI